eukprot:10585539-Ditylum_brightwellii.AAC.1
MNGGGSNQTGAAIDLALMLSDGTKRSLLFGQIPKKRKKGENVMMSILDALSCWRKEDCGSKMNFRVWERIVLGYTEIEEEKKLTCGGAALATPPPPSSLSRSNRLTRASTFTPTTTTKNSGTTPLVRSKSLGMKMSRTKSARQRKTTPTPPPPLGSSTHSDSTTPPTHSIISSTTKRLSQSSGDHLTLHTQLLSIMSHFLSLDCCYTINHPLQRQQQRRNKSRIQTQRIRRTLLQHSSLLKSIAMIVCEEDVIVNGILEQAAAATAEGDTRRKREAGLDMELEAMTQEHDLPPGS